MGLQAGVPAQPPCVGHIMTLHTRPPQASLRRHKERPCPTSYADPTRQGQCHFQAWPDPAQDTTAWH